EQRVAVDRDAQTRREILDIGLAGSFDGGAHTNGPTCCSSDAMASLSGAAVCSRHARTAATASVQRLTASVRRFVPAATSGAFSPSRPSARARSAACRLTPPPSLPLARTTLTASVGLISPAATA